MLLRIITWAIVIGLLYRFVVRFIFPVVHITKMTNDRLQQMQKKMEEMEQKNQTPRPTKTTTKEGDYIDYEEIK